MAVSVNMHSPIIIFIASVIEMSSAADAYNSNNYPDADRVKWSIACGAISVFFTLLQLILLYVATDAAQKIAKPLAVFLVLLWAPGAGVSTGVSGAWKDEEEKG